MDLHKLRGLRLDFSYLIILVTALVYFLTINNGQDWGDDFAMYIMHAQNIVAGRAYADTPYLYNPQFAYIGPRAYPPIYPLMLAPITAIFGTQLAPMKVLDVGCFILFLIFFYKKILQNSDLPQAMQLVILGALAFNPYFWPMNFKIFSDLPFLLFVYLALFQIDQLIKNPAPGWSAVLLTGGLIYLAFGTRMIGIILLPLPLLCELIHWRKIRPTGMIVTAIALMLIIIQSLLINGTNDYFDQFPHNFSQVESIAASVSKALGNSFILVSLSKPISLKMAGFVLVFLVAGAGYGARAWKKAGTMELFTLVFILAMVAWPYFNDMRFLIPVLPMIFVYIFKGIEVILTRFHASSIWMTGVAFLAAALLIVGYATKAADGSFPRKDEIHQPAAVQLMDFVQKSTPRDAGIIFFKPRALAFLTGRRSGRISPYQSVEEVLAQLEDMKVNYIIVRENYTDCQQPAWIAFITKNPTFFTLLFQNNEFRAYQVR